MSTKYFLMVSILVWLCFVLVACNPAVIAPVEPTKAISTPTTEFTETQAPTVTLTAKPHPTSTQKATETREPTQEPTTEAVDYKAISEFFTPQYIVTQPITLTVGSTTISSSMTIGLTPDFIRFMRISRITFDSDELPNFLFEQFLDRCRYQYNIQNPNAQVESLEDYAKLLSEGKGTFTLPGHIDGTGDNDLKKKDPIEVHPLSGLIFLSHTGTMPQKAVDKQIYIALNKDGRFILGSTMYTPSRRLMALDDPTREGYLRSILEGINDIGMYDFRKDPITGDAMPDKIILISGNQLLHMDRSSVQVEEKKKN